MYSAKVIVVGGGVIGLVSALRLALQGVSCIVLERNLEGYWIKGARYFALAEDVVAWLSYWKILDLTDCWPIHDAALRMDSASSEIRFSCNQIRTPYLGVMVNERMLLEMLIKRLKTCSFASIFFSTSLQRIWSDTEHVYLIDDANTVYQGRCCIAADGHRSWVRSQLNNRPFYYDFGQTATTGVVQFQGDAHTVWDFFFKDHCIGILPFSSQEAACILMGTSQRTLSFQDNTFGEGGLFSILNRGLKGKMIIQNLHSWDAHYPLTAGRCLREVQGLVLFLGDALEWMHPLMGQGMNLALRYASKWLDTLPEALISSVCLEKWLLGHRQKNWSIGLGVNVGAFTLQSSFRARIWKGLEWGTFCPGVSSWLLKRARIPLTSP